MDALVLAAGFGSRLRDAEPCKPLARIDGRTLLEIGITQLARAGATRVRVATGYQAAEVEQTLPGIAQRAGVTVEARRVADHTRPNGYSVLAGAEGFTGSFLLAMADHILSDAIYAALTREPPPAGGVVLAVDRRIDHPLIDPDDATWVDAAEDGRIRHIGKTLETFGAVDCGAFHATPALLDAIRAAIAGGKPGSLSEGMQVLADAGMAWTADVGSAWWIDVDDPRTLALARTHIGRHVSAIPRTASPATVIKLVAQ